MQFIAGCLLGDRMTRPRSEQIDLITTPFYHCYTRCVRRSYLCGNDPLTGQDFNHRRGWIVNRLKKLTTIFAIKICAYAVMSNHYHLVLYVNLAQANQWDKEEVFARWQKLFPKDAKKWKATSAPELEERIKLWHERLMNVSWFMRCLNEMIACMANREDGCTGSFWESRFKCQALLDEGAILTAMAYVDLNPIHANMAETPEEADFTSIQERIHYLKQQRPENEKEVNQSIQPPQLMQLTTHPLSRNEPCIDFELSEYLNLVDQTGRIWREDKKGVISDSLAPILVRLRLTPIEWVNMVKGIETDFSHAIGEERMLFIFGKKHNINIKGKKAAKKYYLLAA